MAQMVKNPGDSGSVPGLGGFPGGGNGYPLQYSSLENPMDRGSWWATVHGVAESDMTEQQSRNSGVHVFFSIMFFSGYMPNSGIARSYGSFIPSF